MHRLVVVGDRGNLRVAWPCRFAASRPPRSPASRGGVARRRARANSRAWSRRRRMSGARPSRPRWKNVVKGRVVFHLFTPNRDGSMKNWNFTVNFSIKSNEKWRDHFTVKSGTLDVASIGCKRASVRRAARVLIPATSRTFVGRLLGVFSPRIGRFTRDS